VATFRFTGGSFMVAGRNGKTYDDELKALEKRYKEAKDNDADYKVEESDLELLGLTAKQFVIHYSEKKVPYEETVVLFSKDGTVFLVNERVNDAVRTDTNLDALKHALETLRFKDE
jgi:serine protease Do